MERRSTRSSRRSRVYYKPPFTERAKEGCRQFTAFMFSNVGIIILVVLYTIAGSFMFIAIEGESEVTIEVQTSREKLVELLWKIACCDVNIFNDTGFFYVVEQKIFEHQKIIVDAYKVGWRGGNGTSSDIENKWSFSNSFLYSLTVITTIGYGNIYPNTEWGKIATIIYAIIGMPLFLLYLSNIGDILAKSFKWIYAKLCLCRVCPGVARRRALRERRKTRADIDVGDPDWIEEYGTDGRQENEMKWNNGSLSSESEHNNNNNIMDDDVEDGDDDVDSVDMDNDTETVTVPLTVCLTIMISYILLGAILFAEWEQWNLLDGSYFCFISLSSIGFGDFVPGFQLTGKGDSVVDLSSALCAIYLLLGMALIAMCFNLMQEQVMHKMRTAKKVIRRCFQCDR